MADEAGQNLPGIITSIIPGKRNRNRYSLFVEEAFLLGVSESTLVKFKLARGVEMTPALFQKLRREEEHFTLKSYFLKLLGNRDHARRELRDKAFRKKYPGDAIERVLDELQENGFIDDAGFAEKFAAEKSRRGSWGPDKIRAHLLRKGIGREVAGRAVGKTFEDRDLHDILLNLVLKRKRYFLREEDPFKRRKKIFNYLRRKGYRSGTISGYLDKLMKAVES